MSLFSLKWIAEWGPRCARCEEPSSDLLCAVCEKLFLMENICPLCLGDFCGPSHSSICFACQKVPRSFGNLWVSYRYAGSVADFVISFKNNYPERIREISFFRLLESLPKNYDAVVACASHPRRVLNCGFDSGQVLGRAIAKSLYIPFVPEVFNRLPFLSGQKEMHADERKRFLKLQIHLNGAVLGPFRGARLLLIDDIMTTGATIEHHARLLESLGHQVDVYCLSRAFKEIKVDR